MKYQFTQIGNEAIIPSLGTSTKTIPTSKSWPVPDSILPIPTPSPTLKHYKAFSFNLSEKWTEGCDYPESYHYSDFDLIHKFVFTYNDEKYKSFGINKDANDIEICYY